MTTASMLIATGLALDIIGVIVLALTHGIGPAMFTSNRPPRKDDGADGDVWFQYENGDEEPLPGNFVKAWRRYRRKVGLGAYVLIAIGFAFQFASVLLNVNTP